jgi:hypothetical protein
MLVTPLGRVILLRPVQLSKACEPILMTLLAIVTLVNPLQPRNVPLVTRDIPLGILMLVRPVQ